jgi:hypothetical protein
MKTWIINRLIFAGYATLYLAAYVTGLALIGLMIVEAYQHIMWFQNIVDKFLVYMIGFFIFLPCCIAGVCFSSSKIH